MRVLSVDLGTSNTVAVLSAHGRPPRVVDVDGASMMPSAIYLSEDGGGIVVGREAERRARLDPSRFEPNPKRRIDEGTLLLGTEVVPVTDALAAVLRRVAEETSRQLGGAKPDEVRLTHPAQWGPVRRNVLLSAARQAGFGGQVVLVPEPVAAAAHFASFPGQSLAPGQALAVYDLGAGTFDVAVVGATQQGFAVLAEAGLPDLGGLDVDQALLEHVGRGVSARDPGRWQRLLRPASTADRRAQRALREDVKAGKEALSRHPQTEIPLPEPFGDVLVTRAELESLIRPSLLRSVELLAGTVRSTGMSPDRLAGIYLVGGSSRIPLIATLIAESVRVVPASLDQPETAVALGAHHVPQEGTSMRTHDIGGIAGQRPPGPPPGAGAAAQRPPVPVPVPGPPSGPLPGPQSGPTPQQRMPAPQYAAVQAPLPTPIPPRPVPQPVPSSSKKPWLLVAGVFVLVAIVVTVVVIAKSGSDSGGGTASAGSGGGGGADSATCDTTADSKGMTSCMRDFAGPVVSDGQCVKGMSIGDMPAPETPGMVASTCTLSDEHTVIYIQMPTPDSAKQLVTTLGSDGAPETWSGGGYSGQYYGSDGLLVFSVDGKPLAGMLTATNFEDSDATSPDGLKQYFDSNIKPQ